MIDVQHITDVLLSSYSLAACFSTSLELFLVYKMYHALIQHQFFWQHPSAKLMIGFHIFSCFIWCFWKLLLLSLISLGLSNAYQLIIGYMLITGRFEEVKIALLMT